MPRSAHSSVVLGRELGVKLSEIRVLVVGAGGIGCELVKNLVLAGFGDITIIDLDTIDLSNLNRQFLFRKKDVKQPKAAVAARSASDYDASCKIAHIHGNIKEPSYDISWFKSFRMVLNALDNLDARRHVNRMCVAARVPLIESGTAGYLGQVQPIIKDVTECFDCVPKPIPKSFPVCTIRSTPSAPIHCVVWAKSYLFPNVFGEQEEEMKELDDAAAAGQNALEIDNLRQEALAFTKVRDAMLSSEDDNASASVIFTKVFLDDIARLLTMSDMWKFRTPPMPLDRNAILGVSLDDNSASRTTSKEQAPIISPLESHANDVLRDQRTLTLRDNVLLFDTRNVIVENGCVQRLAARFRRGNGLTFDKDDEDALDFTTAASNLRAFAYDIPRLTRWEVKEMAGNIIPAIATTNAIIAGMIVLQALHVLRSSLGPQDSSRSRNSQAHMSASRNVFLQSGRPFIPLGSFAVSSPNPRCGVCRETYVHVTCDTTRLTLGELIEAVMAAEVAITGRTRVISVYEGGRILSDPDWDDNLSRTLRELNCHQGKFVTLADEDEQFENVSIAVSDTPSAQLPNMPPLIIRTDFAPPQRRAPPLPPHTPSSPVKQILTPKKQRPGKRTAPEDELPAVFSSSASKKRARTEEGLHEMDNDIVMLEVRLPTAQAREALALEEDGLAIVN